LVTTTPRRLVATSSSTRRHFALNCAAFIVFIMTTWMTTIRWRLWRRNDLGASEETDDDAAA
jgi:hypothetical protein